MAAGKQEPKSRIDGQDAVVKRRSRRRSWRSRLRHWYRGAPPWMREYSVEIGLCTAILIALFLLVEQWDIRVTLFAGVRRIWSTLSGGLGEAGGVLVNWARGLTLSDALGFTMLLGVGLIAGWRLRWRAVRNERFWSTHCPECDSAELRRIHRRLPGQVLGALGFPVGRYRCSKCGWKGLRIRSKRIERSSLPKPPAPA